MQQEQHRVAARILDVMEYLAASEGHGYTLTEVATALQIPKSSLFPIIHTLEERKYIQLNKSSGQYTMGIRSYLLGAHFPEERGLTLVSRVMQTVAESCQETCQLGILDGENILYIEKVDSPQAIRMISHVGKRLPANTAAIGKALLSGLSDEGVRQLYAKGLPQLTEHTIIEMDELLAQLHCVRQGEPAWEREESTQQLQCWAVPLRRQGTVFAAISVSVPMFRCTAEKEHLVRESLLRSQQEIERLAEARNFTLV